MHSSEPVLGLGVAAGQLAKASWARVCALVRTAARICCSAHVALFCSCFLGPVFARERRVDSSMHWQEHSSMHAQEHWQLLMAQQLTAI